MLSRHPGSSCPFPAPDLCYSSICRQYFLASDMTIFPFPPAFIFLCHGLFSFPFWNNSLIKWHFFGNTTEKNMLSLYKTHGIIWPENTCLCPAPLLRVGETWVAGTCEYSSAASKVLHALIWLGFSLVGECISKSIKCIYWRSWLLFTLG